MDILAIIPARGGSKGLPGKNVIELDGFPLIAYTIAAAKLSKRITRIIVTTDFPIIAEIALKYGAEVPFMRPSEISTDTSLDIEFINHTLKFLKKNGNYEPNLIVHLSPVIPLRKSKVIDLAILEIIKDKKATSLRSASLFNHSGYKLTKLVNGYWHFFGNEDFKKDIEYYNFPRQLLPNTYIPNGYVDIIKPKTIKETNSLHGDKIKAFITEQTADIDSIEDLIFANQLLLNKNVNELKLIMEEFK